MEQQLAQSLGLSYFFADQRNRKLSWPLPLEYRGPFVLLSNTHTDFSRLHQELLKRCELLIHVNSGYDNFKVSELTQWDFPVVLGNPVRAPAVVEYTLGHLMHRLSFHVHQSHWAQGRHWQRPLLKEKRVLIIGGGTVGQKLKQVLTPLAQVVTVFDPYIEGKTFDKEQRDNLREHLKSHSVILMACGLNRDNHHMISREEFNLLAADYILINPARGALIKEQDLVESLQRKPHAYAVLDVFEEEPFKNQFEGLTNIHLTSHIAGVSSHLAKDMVTFEAKVIEDFKSDKSESKEAFEKDYQDILLQNRIIQGALI